MGLKILHSADWHMGTTFSSFSGEQREFLQREQLKIPGMIAELCGREKCNLVLLAGDIFDGVPAAETVDAVRSALADMAVPVFVSPGNHDFWGTGSAWAEHRWPENVVIFTGALQSVGLPELNCRIYGGGYRSMDCSPLLEGFRVQGEEKYQIAVLHGDAVTARSPYCPVTSAQIRESGLDYLALGHIHKAGRISSGDTVCAWPGCPAGRGWDETGEKGVCIVTVDEKTDVRFVALDGPRFLDMEADVSSGTEELLDSILPAGESADFFRVTLTGQAAVDLNTLQKRYSYLPNLFLRDQTVPKSDLWKNAGDDTFRGVYFRILQQAADHDPRAVLAAEISRKILDGREVRLP